MARLVGNIDIERGMRGRVVNANCRSVQIARRVAASVTLCTKKKRLPQPAYRLG